MSTSCPHSSRMFRWAVENDLCPATVWQRLPRGGLAKGRTKAREPKPVLPVADEVVDATLPHLPPVCKTWSRSSGTPAPAWGGLHASTVATWTDRRRLVVPAGVAQDGTSRPRPDHRHRAQGPGRAAAVPAPRGDGVLLFAAGIGSATKRSPARGAGNTDDAQPGSPTAEMSPPAMCKGSVHERQLPPRRGPCSGIGPTRHARKPGTIRCPIGTRTSCATAWERRFGGNMGSKGAQVVLGHAKANTTEIYAERDLSKAVEIARQVG